MNPPNHFSKVHKTFLQALHNPSHFLNLIDPNNIPMENKLYFPDIINRIWETFPETLTQELIPFLDDGVHLISEKSIK